MRQDEAQPVSQNTDSKLSDSEPSKRTPSHNQDGPKETLENKNLETYENRSVEDLRPQIDESKSAAIMSEN